MIIRPVSDDDSDSDGTHHENINGIALHSQLRNSNSGNGRSVFDTDARVQSSSPPTMHAARLAWIGTLLALIVLLLADVAAIMSHFQRRLHSTDGNAANNDNNDSSDPQATAAVHASHRDPFALFAVLLDAYTANGSGLRHALAVAAGSATALNNAAGIAAAAAWMFTRESAAVAASADATRSRRSQSTNHNNNNSRLCRSLPWLLVGGVVCIGHVVTCAYVLYALLMSNGDHTTFLLGTTARRSAGRSHA